MCVEVKGGGARADDIGTMADEQWTFVD